MELVGKNQEKKYRMYLKKVIKLSEQNKTNLPFNAKQIKFAKLLIDPEDRRSRRDKIAEVGVAPSTAYRWLKDPDYLDYINEQLGMITDSHISTAWQSLITQVKRGDTQAIKLFFELKDKYRDRKEITGQDGEPIKVDTGLDITVHEAREYKND